MSNINIDLQRKIDVLGLLPVDDTIYDKYLKAMENIGVGVRHLKYYKLYGQYFMPYSKEYLIGLTIEELLKIDKKNYKQFCPSFFVRFKRRFDRWLLRKELNKMKKNYIPPIKK